MVFVYHMPAEVFSTDPIPSFFGRLASIGWVGVDLFYVLSGFFITKIIVSPSNFDPIAFIKARSTRIYPAYLVCLFVIFSIYLYHHGASIVTMLAGILHLFMLHNLFPGIGGLFNGVFWTLGVEFPYYLLILIAAPFLRQKNYFWPTTIFLILLAILFRAAVFIFIPLDAMAGFGRFFVSTQVLGALDAFAIGGAAYAMSRRVSHWTHWRKACLWVVGMGIMFTAPLSALFYLSSHAGNYWSEPFSAILWRSYLAAGFGIFVTAAATSGNPGWLRFTGLPWLGKVSFSFYLWHFPLLRGLEDLHLSISVQAQMLLLSVIVCFVSWLSWRFIEIRFHPFRPTSNT